ncbi:MAG: GTPase ObgE [Candidatus Eisenbacteria bacterium]|nr:GTPase ObgE [Candidatus Eisenbacteria bacterium]
MFVDEARIRVVAGGGGDGCVSFRREKFVPRGGPDGGDGGDGGDVVLIVDPDMRTLLHLRHRPLHEAGRGMNGSGKQCSGRRGGDYLIRLPAGTVVRDAETGALVADLVVAGDSFLVARGGKGGKGNVHFKSSTRRSPRFATPGGEGEARDLLLELRLLADVGIVGLPNVGKSTLLSRVSNARPKIGDYAFTTLEPNLGIVPGGEFYAFVMADIPGLVEGAHKGRGLGARFLKHIERTRVLLFLLDSISEDPEKDLQILRREIESWSGALCRRPWLVAFSRADLRGDSWSPPRVAGQEALAFSAHSGRGIQNLLRALREFLDRCEEPRVPEAAPESQSDPSGTRSFAERIDRGEALGDSPWPRQWLVLRSEDPAAEETDD